MKTSVFLLLAGWLLLECSTTGFAQQPAPGTADQTLQPEKVDAANDAAPNREELRKALAEALTGATLVGNFTIDDDTSDKPLKPDRYTLAQVTPVKDDYFQFVYVHQGIPIPLTLKVLWAGDTPVLTLEEFTIAGMGTFSARLMFRLKTDRYAGTWQHGKTGGLMFGRIERAKKPEPKPTDAKSENAVPAPKDDSAGSDQK
ncbi:hypothetical protein GC176_20820 [bacterium]|nr:hypothetical protein [bacterium]